MSEGSTPESNAGPDKGSPSDIVRAWKVVENTEEVRGSNRLIVNGALLGTCFLFLAAMLGMQKLDGDLTAALVSFVIAIPVLIYVFMFASIKAKPVGGWMLLVGLQIGAACIEPFGEMAVIVGVSMVIRHLSPVAFTTLIITSISVVVVGFVASFIGLMIYAVRKHGEEKHKQTIVQEAKP